MSDVSEDVRDTGREESLTSARFVVEKPPKTVALDRCNYFAWRTQFIGALRGNGLLPYLFGQAPLNTTSAIRQDQIILGWILSSLTATVIAEVSQCETAADCWKTLQDEFAPSSRSQVLAIQQKLQNLHKGGKSFSDYIAEINNLVEALCIAGKKIEDEDLVLLVVAGLGDEYESLIQNITVRRDTITYKEVKSMFMDVEVRKSRSNIKNPLSANVVEAEKSHSKQGKNSIKSTPCQICNIKGHGALNCYHRLNLTKYPPTHGRTLTPNAPKGKMSANLAQKGTSRSVWYSEQGQWMICQLML